MADTNTNHQYYTGYNWRSAGEEWSAGWGDTYSFWYGSVMPRLCAYLPFGDALEIGCGYGRLAAHALNYCDNLALTDIAQNCVDACRERFAQHPHVTAYLSDGVNLPFVEDHSLDFIFSINSLVHSDAETLQGLLKEIARVLRKGGCGFFHHSNAEIYTRNGGVKQAELAEFRDVTTSAILFSEWANSAGLQCIRQENINWGTAALLSDTFSIVCHRQAFPKSSFDSINNTGFWKEIQYQKKLHDHYSLQTTIEV